MQVREIPIFISSINRIKMGTSREDDFTIRFNPTLVLGSNMIHKLAVDMVSMTYSWHNITTTYNNNVVRYSPDNGSSWETINIEDGMYSYEDINDYIHNYLVLKGHKTGDTYPINISFILSTYRVLIEVSANYQFEMTKEFGILLGFDQGVITKTTYSPRLPNITNNVDSILIHSNMTSDSVVDGELSNVLYKYQTDTLIRGRPFSIKPKRLMYCPVTKDRISDMRFYVTDGLNRPLDLNGINWSITLILRSTVV